MKNLLNKSAVLTISLLTINAAVFAAYAPSASRPADRTASDVAASQSPSFMDKAKSWWQETFGTDGYEKGKAWLSEKLGFDVNPERFRANLEELKMKIRNATPEQITEFRQNIQQKISDLQEKIRTATPEQKAKFQNMLEQLRQLASERMSSNRPAMPAMEAARNY